MTQRSVALAETQYSCSSMLQSKFDEIEADKIKRQNASLLIEEAVLYEDGRSHFVFNDKSSIILHPNGDCMTYFSPDGRKNRQLVKFALKGMNDGKGSMMEKLFLAIQFYNTFADEPIVTREEAFS